MTTEYILPRWGAEELERARLSLLQEIYDPSPPVPDVEPTHNAAERGLRAAVIYRKLSLGSRSQGGERLRVQNGCEISQWCPKGSTMRPWRSPYGWSATANISRAPAPTAPTAA
jgi:hypothetical protein